jgi:hypothetical protein
MEAEEDKLYYLSFLLVVTADFGPKLKFYKTLLTFPAGLK